MDSLEFRRRVLKGDKLIGAFLNTGSPTIAEIAGVCGLDWCLLDMEHGSGSWEMLAYQLMALHGSGAAPIVRLPSIDNVYFKRALDLGAWGLMLPNVNTAEEAENAVAFSRYPPRGTRGVSSVNRGARYGIQFDEQLENAHLSTLIIAQIESPLALENLEEIASVDGVDALFVGPADLSVTMGIPKQFEHPDFLEAIGATVRAASRSGKASGILGFTESDIQRYYTLGFSLVAVGSDAGMVAKGFNSLVATSRQYRQ
jgi:4-hydroxy-2-oxoheptanedioate aldolase